MRVLFVPLHLIDPSRDLVEEVGRFVKDEGVLPYNPLAADSAETNLLVLFDGLDELASQGKAAAETARAFIREVERTLERRNVQAPRLRVVISGRELVVQENESELRPPRQVLALLPYFVPSSRPHRFRSEMDEYKDTDGLLEIDLRQQWWTTYGRLTGRNYDGLPDPLRRPDLDEITAQPLLNYLIALSFSRDRIDFSQNVNLNLVYADLVAAVHERAYERSRPYAPIRHMSLNDFVRVLEEVGLAAWHGDGRTTTVREIEEHCRASGVGTLLDAFQEGARAGITRLLAAFFFRQYGQRSTGDPTFVFTHKSFGEYLAARRIVRATEKVVRELERRAEDPDEGWDERDALRSWALLCGSTGITLYLLRYILDELRLRQKKDLRRCHKQLERLFTYMLSHGVPMEQLNLPSFKDALFQSRNAEEALLALLNACARTTGNPWIVQAPDPTRFGGWFRRIQGQRTGPESVVAASCLSLISLKNATLDIGDFYGCDFSSAKLFGLQAHYACFINGRFEHADLQRAVFIGARLESTNFTHANLGRARMTQSICTRAHFNHATLTKAELRNADLTGADFEYADLRGADLRGANFASANLVGANLDGANLTDANLQGARLKGTRIRPGDLDSDSAPSHSDSQESHGVNSKPEILESSSMDHETAD